MSYSAIRFTSMHNVRSGMLAHMGIADAIAAEQAVEHAATTLAPRGYANVAFGPRPSMRMDCITHPEVKVTYLRARGHRTWQVKFTY